MAIAPQPAMQTVTATTRPTPRAGVATSRHTVLLPVPEPRVALVVTRLATLMLATSFAIGIVCAVALALVTGTLTDLGN
jgi:hypothetical protein